MKLNYFNFKNFKEQMLLTNDFGRYLFVSKENFQDILSLKIEKKSDIYRNLIDAKMIYDE